MFNELKKITESAYTAMEFANKEWEEMKGPNLTPSQKGKLVATLLALKATQDRINSYRSTLFHRLICLLKGERHLGTKIQEAIERIEALNQKPVAANNKNEVQDEVKQADQQLDQDEQVLNPNPVAADNILEEQDDVQGQIKAYQEILDLDRQILRLGFSVRRWNFLMGFSNDRYQQALQECDQAAEEYAKLEKNEKKPIRGLLVSKEDVEKAQADWEAKKEKAEKYLKAVNMQKRQLSDEEAKLEQATQAYHACLKTHPEIAYFTPDELKAHIELLKNNR